MINKNQIKNKPIFSIEFRWIFFDYICSFDEFLLSKINNFQYFDHTSSFSNIFVE